MTTNSSIIKIIYNIRLFNAIIEETDKITVCFTELLVHKRVDSGSVILVEIITVDVINLIISISFSFMKLNIALDEIVII